MPTERDQPALSELLTRLQAAAQGLRESRQALEHYRYLFLNSPLPAWVYDVGTLKFLVVNRAACLQYGYSEAEFLTMDLSDIRPKSEIPNFLAHVGQPHGEYHRSGPWQHQARDGRLLLVEINCHEMTYEGRAARFVVANDVTEREAAKSRLLEREEQLVRANARLARSNADLDDFAHTVSHDLQEPLRAVSGYATLLTQRQRDLRGEDARVFLGFIQDGAHRMQAMIESLLLYSRVLHHTLPAEPVDLNEAVEWACANLESAIEKSKGRVIRERLPVINGSEFHMGQLFQNLIANALKYRAAETPVVKISAARTNGTWRIEVADNGVGIPKEHHESIFRIFRRLDNGAEPGSGVGLALCKKIAERYGGEIWVESEPGCGSRFYVSFPAQ